MNSFIKSGFTHLALLFACINLAAQERSVNQSYSPINKEDKMTITTNKNKEVVRKVYDDCLNKRNWEMLDKLVAADYEGANGGHGVPGFAQPVKAVINAFPDIQWEVLDLLEDGDQVAVRWKWEGTHLGTFNVYEATKKKVVNEGMAIFQLSQGKIISQKLLTDRLGFLQQIDVLPKDLIVQQQTNK